MSGGDFAAIKADGAQGGAPMPISPQAQASISSQISPYLPTERGTDVAGEISAAPYNLGAKVNDSAAKYLPAPVAAGLGTAANVGMEAAGMLAGGSIGGGVATATAKPVGEGLGKWLMQKALKPYVTDFRKGKADRAIETLLEEGINVSRGGVEKLRGIGEGLNRQVSSEIAASSAKIPQTFVDDAVGLARSRFANSPDQVGDFASIDSAASKFLANNRLTGLGSKEAELAAAVEQRRLARIAALQDAGRYRTMAAQQANLAHGGGVNVAKTPMNEPYMNVGSQALGEGRSLSPSAYPVAEGMIGQPRIPGRYTENMQRVPEAQSAAAEFERVARLRRIEQEQAALQLAEHRMAGGSGVPIQTAQDLKQGLYQNLKDKYGTLQAPEVETQKLIASVLRGEIEKGAPAVAPLNKRASDIWNALNVTERRALVGGNNNPVSLPAAVSMVHNPAFGASMIANTSDLAKSLVARALYQSGKAAPAAGTVGGAAAAAALMNQGER